MNDITIKYLMKKPLLHMGMIEAIRRNTADIIHSDNHGMLIKEKKSNAYMITADNFDKGKELVGKIPNCSLIVSHQGFMTDYIMNKFGLIHKIEVVQAVYMKKEKLHENNVLEIRKLTPDQISVVLENYHMLSYDEIKEILDNGNLFGGYKNGILVGFVGIHLEGSLGLLEIFPQYRQLGYGTMLESYLVNRMLEKDLVPFGQIEKDNLKSIKLQRKLGFEISQDVLYWME